MVFTIIVLWISLCNFLLSDRLNTLKQMVGLKHKQVNVFLQCKQLLTLSSSVCEVLHRPQSWHQNAQPAHKLWDVRATLPLGTVANCVRRNWPSFLSEEGHAWGYGHAGYALLHTQVGSDSFVDQADFWSFDLFIHCIYDIKFSPNIPNIWRGLTFLPHFLDLRAGTGLTCRHARWLKKSMRM